MRIIMASVVKREVGKIYGGANEDIFDQYMKKMDWQPLVIVREATYKEWKEDNPQLFLPPQYAYFYEVTTD